MSTSPLLHKTKLTSFVRSSSQGKPTSRIWHLILTFACVLFLAQCSSVGGSSSLANTTYSLARTATNVTTNALRMNLAETAGYTFSIAGENFAASVAKDQRLPPQDSVTLTYTEEGTYTLIFTVYQSDGSIIIRDSLKWRYSTEVPPDPIVTFSEVATNDDKVLMLVALNKGANTKELGVEGDLASGNFAWLPIPDTGAVPVVVSADDGMKNFTVRYRNIFGTESRNTIDLSILKKSIGPQNCSVTINGTTTATLSVRVQMAAENAGDLFYIPVGDVKSSGEFTKFSQNTVATVELLGEGPIYKFSMQVRDIAENYCPTTTFNITFDPNHTAESIQIANHLLWSDDPIVTAEPMIDHVGSDTVEMYLHGDIQPSAKTFQWIPYEPSVQVQLSPVDGNRFVRVKYRLNGVESVVRSTPIFLAPFIRLHGNAAPYTIELSNIVGLNSATITGCAETYQSIPYQTNLPCTPTGSSVGAIYSLSDGSQISRSSAVF